MSLLNLKLNKTEATLLEKVHDRKVWVVIHGYRTGRKSPWFGTREWKAAISLRDKGLVVFKRIGNFVDCKSAYSDHWSEIVVTLPEAKPEATAAN